MHVQHISNQRPGSKPVVLIRQSYREGKTVKKRTLANISFLPEEVIDVITQMLKGRKFIAMDEAFVNVSGKSHGHVEAVLSMMKKLKIAELIDKRPSHERNLVMAMIAARILGPKSKLSTAASWHRTTLPEELGIEDATENDLYEAMDWLYGRMGSIERRLVSRHIKLGDMAFYDVSSSYIEGTKNELAKYGHSRDKKRGKTQVNYGVTTDVDGRPLTMSVFAGNVNDSTTLLPVIDKLRNEYGLSKLVVVGDRGMLTKKNIKVLASQDDIDWVSALRATSIKGLVEQKHLQMGLFDERDLFEFVAEDTYPGERLIACRNTSLMASRAHKRESLLSATEKKLQPIMDRVNKGTLNGQNDIALAVGRVIDKHKVRKHFILHITDNSFTFERDEAKIKKEAMLDGIYVIRTSLSVDELDASSCVRSYKNLAKVERAFRTMKGIDLRIRPIFHFTEHRVRTHLFLCMLSFYVVWHMREAWKELTFADEEDDFLENPVAPKERSKSASDKGSKKVNEQGMPVNTFAGVIEELSMLQRNYYQPGSNVLHQFKMIQHMNPLQARALDLINEMNVVTS